MRAREGLAVSEQVVTLDAESVEAVARRTAELLRGAPLPGDVDATTVATALGTSRDFVYRHANRLGGRRLGSGPRARLRFDLDQAVERARNLKSASLSGSLPDLAENGSAKRKPGRPRGSGKRQPTRLLPITGPTPGGEHG